jgi:hypothetical protein
MPLANFGNKPSGIKSCDKHVNGTSVPKRIATVAVLLFAVLLLGCGPSKKLQAIQKQEAIIAEMKRVQAAFGDLQIAIDAGVLREEFSQRTNDALVKIGDLKRSEGVAESGFPAARDKVAEIYAHFNSAAKIYTLSKQFLGPNPAPLGDGDEDGLDVPEYEMLQKMFPDAYEHGGYFTIASRSYTVKGLWKLAEGDTKTAGELIDQLSTPAN